MWASPTRGNDGKPLADASNGLAGLEVLLHGELTAHADMGVLQGSGGVWLGKGKLACGRGYGWCCGFGGCLGQGLALGTGSPTADPLRVRIAG